MRSLELPFCIFPVAGRIRALVRALAIDHVDKYHSSNGPNEIVAPTQSFKATTDAGFSFMEIGICLSVQNDQIS